MSLPQFVPASLAKTKVDTCTLSSHGQQFFGFMHDGGTAMSPTINENVHQDMIFLPCRNRGCCTWLPCAVSSKPFKSFQLDTYINCSFALMIGLIQGPDELSFQYLKWRYDLGSHKNLSSAIASHKNAHESIHALFYPYPRVTSIKKIHVRFLTQVAGPVLGNKPLDLAIAERGGLKYIEMRPMPDLWSLS